MAKKLLIVESPAKVKTIRGFLGDEFIVAASLGHIRDLPGHDLGVEVANGFRSTYEVLPGKQEVVKRLKGLVKALDLTGTPPAEQQAASITLGFSPEKTMQLAQALYEGVDIGGIHCGLITYMRTDAVHVAPEAQAQAPDVIRSQYGTEYLPTEPPVYKNRNPSAQEAHEAIRPTDAGHLPTQVKDILSEDLCQLYALTWSRFLASQMAPARFAETAVTVQSEDGAARFRARGRTLLFEGFLRVYAHEDETADQDDAPGEQPLPDLIRDERLLLTAWSPVQHFTRPPGRYSEAGLCSPWRNGALGGPPPTPAQLPRSRRGVTSRSGANANSSPPRVVWRSVTSSPRSFRACLRMISPPNWKTTWTLLLRGKPMGWRCCAASGKRWSHTSRQLSPSPIQSIIRP